MDIPAGYNPAQGAMIVALAAYCAVRGLTPTDADAMCRRLIDEAVPDSVGQTMRMLDDLAAMTVAFRSEHPA